MFKFRIAINCVFLIIIGLIAYLIARAPKQNKPSLVVSNQQVTLKLNETTPLFESQLIPKPNSLLQSHSATLQQLNDGSLIALWFGGSHEAKHDVQIWQSIYKDRIWSLAKPVVSPKRLAIDSQSFVYLIGNPVVYLAKDNSLYLFVTSVGVGGWALSTINQLRSTDNGNSWHKDHRLILSPIFNRSNLVRSTAIPLKDGGFYLPIYHEMFHTYPQIIRFNAQGKMLYSYRINSNLSLLQPSLVPLSQSHLLVFYRNANRYNNYLYMQQSLDAGRHWSKLIKTNLTNNDTSIAVVSLPDNSLLMAHNINGREQLALASSKDGITWQPVVFLEKHDSGEYSYPSMIVHDNIIDLVYTYERKYIKHVRFNLTWLNKQLNQSDITK